MTSATRDKADMRGSTSTVPGLLGTVDWGPAPYWESANGYMRGVRSAIDRRKDRTHHNFVPRYPVVV